MSQDGTSCMGGWAAMITWRSLVYGFHLRIEQRLANLPKCIIRQSSVEGYWLLCLHACIFGCDVCPPALLKLLSHTIDYPMIFGGETNRMSGLLVR